MPLTIAWIDARRWAAAAASLAAATFTLSYQLPVFDRWFSYMDEGHILLYADIIAQGGELYRDATVYPLPGAFYLLAALFRIFEPSIWLGRVVVVIEFAVLAGLAFRLMLAMTSWRLALWSLPLLFLYRVWAFPHWHMYSYSSTSLLLIVVALVLLLRYASGRSLLALGLAGLASGLAVLCKQDYGAAGGVALTILLGVTLATTPARSTGGAGRAIAVFFAPALAVGAATALHFLRQGLLGEMLRQTVLGHLRGIGSFEYSTLPSLLPVFSQDPALRDGLAALVYAPSIMFTVDWGPWQQSWLYRETVLWEIALKLFFFGPYLLAAAGAARLWRHRGEAGDARRRDSYLHEVGVFGLGALLLLSFNLNRPQDFAHLGILYFPWLLLGPVYVRGLCDRLRALRPIAARLAAAVVLLPLVALLAYSTALLWQLRERHDTPLAAPRGGILVVDHEARMLNGLVAYVQAETRPREAIAVLPYFPILPFLADRRGPHRASYIIWPVPDIAHRDRVVAQAMEDQQTRVVIYSFTQFLQLKMMDEYAPRLFRYLVDHFEIARVFSEDYAGYMLAALRREPRPQRGWSLLGSDRPQPEIRIEGPEQKPHVLQGKERQAYYALEPWPFRDVAVLRPSSGGGRSVLRIELEVPAAASLETAVGTHPRMWFDYPGSWVEFEIEVLAGGRRERVFAKRLDPHRVLGDRGWRDVRIPLGAYAGQRVALELSTRCERPRAESRWMAGFGLPRLVSDADPDISSRAE